MDSKLMSVAIGMLIVITLFASMQMFLYWHMISNPKITPITIDDGGALYERVIQRFAEVHEYNRTEYNCANYSHELSDVLEKLGYNTDYVVYKVNQTASHAVINLTLEIEPQTAEIIINRVKGG